MIATLRAASVSDVTTAAIVLHRARLASPDEMLLGSATTAHAPDWAAFADLLTAGLRLGRVDLAVNGDRIDGVACWITHPTAAPEAPGKRNPVGDLLWRLRVLDAITAVPDSNPHQHLACLGTRPGYTSRATTDMLLYRQSQLSDRHGKTFYTEVHHQSLGSWLLRPRQRLPQPRLVPIMGALLLQRIFRPSYPFLQAYRATKLYAHVELVIAPEVFTRITQASSDAGLRAYTVRRGLNVIAKMVLHTGRAPDELTAEDVFRFRSGRLRTRTGRFQSPQGTHAAWVLLRRSGIITGPENLIEALRRGQRPTAETVDSYLIKCRPIRDLLVRYLDERRPGLDYGTFRALVGTLAGRFWADLE